LSSNQQNADDLPSWWAQISWYEQRRDHRHQKKGSCHRAVSWLDHHHGPRRILEEADVVDFLALIIATMLLSCNRGRTLLGGISRDIIIGRRG
jgi:hypothetical protein